MIGLIKKTLLTRARGTSVEDTPRPGGERNENLQVIPGQPFEVASLSMRAIRVITRQGAGLTYHITS